MIKINTCDGRTELLDLGNEQQAKEWLKILKRLDFQKKITGVSVVQRCNGHFKCSRCNRSQLVCSNCGQPAHKTVCNTGVQYSLSKPIGFDKAIYHIEQIKPDEKTKTRGGEKVTCLVGDIKATLMIHACQPAAKISLVKVGKQRFDPIVK